MLGFFEGGPGVRTPGVALGSLCGAMRYMFCISGAHSILLFVINLSVMILINIF